MVGYTQNHNSLENFNPKKRSGRGGGKSQAKTAAKAEDAAAVATAAADQQGAAPYTMPRYDPDDGSCPFYMRARVCVCLCVCMCVCVFDMMIAKSFVFCFFECEMCSLC